MSKRDEAHRRITKKLRFPLLDAEMEEILNICAEAWNFGFEEGVIDQAIYEKHGIGEDRPLKTNPYSSQMEPDKESLH